jgi:peptidoglycan/xylan/chitin deacetylase (PgdA/CDA1 family)
VKRVLVKSGLAAAALRLVSGRRTPRAVIIRYHAIRPTPALEKSVIPPGICHTSEQLRAHLIVLRKHFRPLALPELLRILDSGEAPPPRSVVLTFDDGFADNYLVAAPILDEFGIKASFFLTTGLIGTAGVPWFCATQWMFDHATASTWTEPTFGRRWTLSDGKSRTAARYDANLVCAAATLAQRTAYLAELQQQLASPLMPLDAPLMLDWRQARALLDAGHQVDSHTVSHPNMALLSRSDAQWEASESRSTLRSELGAGGSVFCYPNPFGQPNVNTLTREVLRAAGYSAALLVQPGTIDGGTDRLSLPRIASPADAAAFRLFIERHLAGFA